MAAVDAQFETVDVEKGVNGDVDGPDGDGMGAVDEIACRH